MPTTRHCAECGTPLPEDAPEGACPVCALRGALEVPDDTAGQAVTEKPGDRIGRYKLLEKIGEGGYGIVYMAEQSEPIRRRVALKVVKLGMDTKQVIARFEAERQALALMDHSNIAKVLDAGATDTGRPYFVMELVRGIKITDYCDQHKVETKERLELFIQVCHAVQHAHQKGIIHRDLKPSNILVTRLDGAAVPKVIDFGIAKAAQQPLTSKTLFTAFQQFVGTPAYMSPEQAEMSGADVDTRSDIYSLGVLLYELVTGHTPFETRELMRAGFDELRRLIREEEPPRPSTRLRTLALDDLTTVAKRQRTEPPKLIHRVRGDLDWIVMKCLEKDRARRYETANGLARDVERHLNNEPVAAAAPGALYRISKFARRHLFGLVMAHLVVSIMAAGVVAGLSQALRANRAERLAKESLALKIEALQTATQEKGKAEKALKTALDAQKQAENEKVEAERQKTEKDKALRLAQERGASEEDAKKLALENLRKATNAEAATLKALVLAGDETVKAEAALERASKQQAETEQLSGFMLGELSDKLIPSGRVDLLTNITMRALAHYESLTTEELSDEALSRRFEAFKKLGYALSIQGYSSNALDTYTNGLRIAELLAAKAAAVSKWQAELCLCHRAIGEILQARGDSGWALKEFQQSLEIAQRCATRFPKDTQWLWHSIASQFRIGDMLSAQAETRQARDAYTNALGTAAGLGKTDPQDKDWRLELSANCSEIGPLLVREWGVERARQFCERCLALAGEKAANETGNTRRKADLATATENLGDVHLLAKETEKARDRYHEALGIRYELVNSDPANTGWQRDLLRSSLKISRALSYESRKSRVLGILVQEHKTVWNALKKSVELAAQPFSPTNSAGAKALRAVHNSVEAAAQLAQKDPANVQWQDDLARGLTFRGGLLFQAKQIKNALADYQEAAKIRHRLAGSDTNAIYLQYGLAASHANVAAALWRLKRRGEASQEARAGLDVLVRAISSWPRTFKLLDILLSDPHDLPNQAPFDPDQRDDVLAAFQAGFDRAAKRAGAKQDKHAQEEWGDFCSQMAVASLLKGEIAQSALYAQKDVANWQQLCRTAPADAAYKSRLAEACTAWGAFQLLIPEPQAAINAARLGLEAEPSAAGCKAILALGLLCNRQEEEGVRVLLQNRGLKAGLNQAFPEVVLADLRRLCAKGLIQLDVARVERRLTADLSKAPE